MSEQNNTQVIGADVKRLPFKDLVKRIGPGLIATGIVIGPGAVTTAAMVGSSYGYSLMWLIFPIIFMGMTFMMVTNRLAIVTGMPTIHAIRKYYGPVASGIVSIATFLACLFFTMGNISGTGAGMNLIFGINWKVGSVILIAVVLYCYFAKNVYSKVEKLITACILAMIVSFYATLIGVGGPEWGSFGKGLVGFQLPEGSLGTALAFISTNAAITAGIYNTYLGKEKKWKKEDLFNGVMFTDALVHILSVVLISGAIMLVGAVVLHPEGKTIKAPAQLAELLVPIMGGAAKYIMGFALLLLIACQHPARHGAVGRRLRQGCVPGEQVHQMGLPGLPDLRHGRLLQLRRFSHAADPHGQHCHLRGHSLRRPVRSAAAVAEGRKRGLQEAHRSADLHDHQLYLCAVHDLLRSEHLHPQVPGLHRPGLR